MPNFVHACRWARFLGRGLGPNPLGRGMADA